MKISKYPQSCLIIEKNGKRGVIDPGTLVSAVYKAEDLLPLDFILITHEHPDHIDPVFIKQLTKPKSIPVIGNESTSRSLAGILTKIIHDKDEFNIEGFEIKVRDLPHVLMVDGSPGPQNSGYVIDGMFFDPGDGLDIQELQVDAAAVPIAGPDISPKDVYDFIKEIGCKTVIPIHNDFFKSNPALLSNKHFYPGINVILLSNGESTDI